MSLPGKFCRRRYDPAVHTNARDAIRALGASKIREVANAGMGRAGVLPFWFGEPDEVTPEFIRRAAVAALDAGDTFYTQNFGIPELREALAAYVTHLHGARGAGDVALTNSGMSALMLSMQALLDPGDRVVAVTPLWPNLIEAPKILGAQVATVPLRFGAGGWQLDVDALIDALTPATRMLIVNSPSNPTGWVMPRAALRAVLEHCRRHGIWILADDAYERLFYGSAPGAPAPTFLDFATDSDRVVSANTFSKPWLMTGWRLGWIVAPASLIADIGKIIEYNTSCSPGFVQRAGLAAVTGGEPVIQRFAARLKAARDFLIPRLNELPAVEAVAPAGAMYAFFRVAGMADSLAFCKTLVAEHGLGLAPGAAFGPAGEGYIRWCFAASHERLAEGVARFAAGLAAAGKA